MYTKEQYDKRAKLLTEYYKFHNDVPRLFMMPIAETIHNFYDKKRRLNYIKVTKMLKGEVDWGKQSTKPRQIHPFICSKLQKN